MVLFSAVSPGAASQLFTFWSDSTVSTARLHHLIASAAHVSSHCVCCDHSSCRLL